MVIAPVVQAELVPAVSLSATSAAAAASARPAASIRQLASRVIQKRASKTSRRAFFCDRDSRSRSGLLPAESRWGYCHSIRAAAVDFAGRKVVRFGANMSGVIVAMRRTLLSCTSLARDGLIALGARRCSADQRRPQAGDLSLDDAVSSCLDLNRQEFAVLTTALALLGFSVVAAILLMRTRVRAATNEARLRAEIGELQARGRPVPRAAVRGAADPDLVGGGRQPAANQRRHLAADAAGGAFAPAAAHPRVWNLAAAGAGAADGSCGRRAARGRRGFSAQPDHIERTHRRGHGPRHRRPGHRADSRTRRSSPRTRRIQHLRYKTLLDETDMLRGFAAAAPWPIWAKSAKGAAALRQCRLCAAPPRPQAPPTLSSATSNCSTARPARRWQPGAERQCQPSPRGCRSWSAASGASMTCMRSSSAAGSAGIAIDASEATALRAALVRMAEAHRRTLDQLSSGVAVFDGQRRLAFYNDSYRRLWDLDRAFLDGNPDDSSVLDRLRAARKSPRAAGLPRLEGQAARSLSRGRAAKDTWYLPDGRAVSVVTTPNPEGGVTYLFDDVTESLELARRFDGLIRVQRETLDNLAEAVAVFGSNGRAQLFNPAFARMWKLSAEALREQPHIETVEAWCKPLFDDASDLADDPRGHHRDREPGRGAAEAGTQGRQRAGLHDHAAARRRHHADVPGHHRYRERRAGAARAQRGARDRRPDEGRFRPPRVLRTAFAADHHHRLRAFPERPRRPAR